MQNSNSARAMHSFLFFWLFFFFNVAARLRREIAWFLLFVEGAVAKQTSTIHFPLPLILDNVLRNSTPGEFAFSYISQR